MSTPLKSPATTPISSDTASASAATAARRLHRRAGAGIGASGSVAATMADRLAMPTTDRSIPPVSIVSVMASARMANSGNWNAIEVRFCPDRKRSGDSADMKTKTASAMTASRDFGVWTSSGGQCGTGVMAFPSGGPGGGALGLPGGQAGADQDQKADGHGLPGGRDADHDQAVAAPARSAPRPAACRSACRSPRRAARRPARRRRSPKAPARRDRKGSATRAIEAWMMPARPASAPT